MTPPDTSAEPSLEDRLGELLLTGFQGLELGEDTQSFLTQAGIGGVILFAHNYESPAQVAELSRQIQSLAPSRQPKWISVDQEGGRVQRFKRGFTRIPEAGKIAERAGPKAIYEISQIIARELAAVGINLNFAPVADILTEPSNPVIGSRAWGSTEEAVTRSVTAFVRGHLVHGVQPCVKHFPGHGDTRLDSHFALPRVDTPLETLRAREFRPFAKAAKSHCAFIMTAHVILSAVDPDAPATLSKKVIRDLLRGELRYSRIVVSDDLEMKAIADHFGADEVPRRALEAGCDLLIYRSEAAARHAYSCLRKDLASGSLAPEIVHAALQRLEFAKSELLMPRKELPDVADLAKTVGLPESQAFVDASIQ